MSVKPDNSTCIYGSGILMKYLLALLQEVDGVRAARDIEHIHRMRVASRRLRAALPLFSACYPDKKVNAWTKEIRRITRALGEARDTDVQIDRLTGVYHNLPDRSCGPGLRRLILRLKQRRAGLQANVIEALDRIAASGVTSEMSEYFSQRQSVDGQPAFSRALYQLAFEASSQRLDDLFSYEPYVSREECVAELHAMRIAAKRLRYTLETFAQIYPPQMDRVIKVVRKIQDALGEIHDCDVWIAFLPNFFEEERGRILKFYGTAAPARRLAPGIAYLLESRREERKSLYDGFVMSWDQWKQDRVWQSLENMIRRPVSFQGEIYPPAPPAAVEPEPGVLEE